MNASYSDYLKRSTIPILMQKPATTVSVITVVLNGESSLAACLESVAEQSESVEHIVVDGGSTDGTVGILGAWNRHPIIWSSEKDRGISDAFNKGIARASGDIITLLNADDRWLPGTVTRSIECLAQSPQAGFCFGHCVLNSDDGQPLLNLGDPRYWEHMRLFMPDVNHPTMFVRRSAYDLVGLYDQQWRFSMDFDWLQRAERVGVRGVLIDAVQTAMSMGGISDRQWRTAYAETRDIAIAYGAPRLVATVDYWYRLLKGSARRGFDRLGLTTQSNRIRRWRQQVIHRR
jgi:glycosyltransferase involved in cell wall biosynthesis